MSPPEDWDEADETEAFVYRYEWERERPRELDPSLVAELAEMPREQIDALIALRKSRPVDRILRGEDSR